MEDTNGTCLHTKFTSIIKSFQLITTLPSYNDIYFIITIIYILPLNLNELFLNLKISPIPRYLSCAAATFLIKR